MADYEVSASIAGLIVHAAGARGVDTAALCDECGFDLALASDPDARIPHTQETALWERAAEQTGDPAFGLHSAELIQPGRFDVLDYALRTAPTLYVSLERLARYNRLLHDVAAFSLIELPAREGREAVLRIEHSLPPGAAQSRHAAEFTLASLVVVGGQLVTTAPAGAAAGQRLPALSVELRHAADAQALPALRELFGVEPRFGCPVNAVELPLSVVSRALPSADPALYRVIERHAEALLAQRPAPQATTSDRVQQRLIAALNANSTDVSLGAIAGELRLSERSLQRRLADEGTSFDALLEQLRLDLALRYLGDQSIAIAEVAYLLGYSEASAFHRAFKRWTGKTPGVFARRSRAPTSEQSGAC